MLLLFQTADGGYAIFKELDDQAFELKAFSKLKTISKATQETTLPISNRQARKRLRKFLRVHCHNETLGVADSKLRSIIKYKLKIDCVHNNDVMELMRDLRYQVTELVVCLASQNMAPMNLGLCHRLSIYQKKFNTDKVEAMIVQAIDLLSNNDIKLNEISVRLREQYGCHFPELSKITMDNIQYARTVKMMCECIDVAKHHFSKILSEEVETELKEASITSMGTEIGEVELGNIIKRCDEVLALSEYRATFYNDLKIRINTIIPDLIAMVEEIVGARLISRNSKTITEVASQLPNDASQCQIQTLNMIMMLFKR
ncbi:hypothetical protein TSUD_90080 [Trifolium subterraneum]|uniref:NOSIC domain-containing protein n=1 Tax=Trifolium subterraneum TaxID=3900 RepID=A0A2Z6NZI2_TRISU|nr:hypothetical protein TSUD_90080 [Trifolium subterraneum]